MKKCLSVRFIKMSNLLCYESQWEATVEQIRTNDIYLTNALYPPLMIHLKHDINVTDVKDIQH